MADEQESAPGGVSGLMQDFVAQLRGVTERLEDLTGLGQTLSSAASSAASSAKVMPSLPALRTWPTPGTFSAAQLSSIASGVAAQRRSIEALKTQLTAFDEQLALLERMLEPLAEWSKTWAGLEDLFIHAGRGSRASEPPDPEAPDDQPR